MADVKAKVKTPKKKASKREKKDWIAAYILIAPVTLGLLVFYIWPFIQNVWFSFNDVNKFNMSTFVGLANYKEMIGDKEVWRTFGNTLKYVIVTVPVGLALSTFLAALLNAKIKGKSIYRTLYFLPSVTMSAAVAMVWKWIYNEQMGILNSAIKAMGGTGHNWLTDSKTALFMIMIVGLWMTVGYNMIILLAGYAFGRIEFPFKNAIFILVLSVLMVPGQIFLLPQYQIVQKLGLLDTIPALFLPNLFSAFGTFLLRQFFMSLPKELEEAAIVDGCGRFRIFAQIMLPLIKPGIVAMSIFTIKFAWNDFMWPLIVNTSMNKMTLGPALSTLQGQYTTEYPMQMAGAVLAVLPLVVMFFIFQKQFIEGVAQSGIKG